MVNNMSIDPITAGLEVFGKVIDKIFPDKTQADAAKAELLRMQINGDLQLALGQQEINKVEAASSSTFVAGGRPFVMWVCGFALAYISIIEPIARFVAAVCFHYTGVFPVVDTTITLQVLLGLLGLAGMRSYDKKNGVAS